MSQEDYKTDPRKSLDEKNGRKGPKFSIYWIYAIVAIFLIGYQVMRGVTPDAIDIKSELSFRQNMLEKNDVERIEPVMNRNIVRVYIKKDSLNKPYYKQLLGDDRWKIVYETKDGPHFQFP